MASYSFLFVGGSASASTIDQEVIDMIEGFGSDTWTGTYRIQSGGQSITGFDLVVFASTGVFVSNFNSWSDVDIPMFVPSNRVNGGLEPFSSSGSRGGSHNQGRTPSGALHPILEDAGFSANSTVTIYGGAVQAYQNVADLGSGVDVLLTDPSDSTEWLLAVADTGASMDSGTATNRRAAMNELEDINGNANGEALVESVMRWLVDGLAPAIDTTASISGGGDISVTAANQHTGSADVSGGGDITLAVHSRQYQVDISGGGDVATTVTHISGGVSIDLEGGGEINVSPVFDWIRPVDVEVITLGTEPTDAYREVVLGSGQFEAVIELVDESDTVLLTTSVAVGGETGTWGATSPDLDLLNVPGYQRTMALSIPVPSDRIELVPGTDGTGLLNPRSANRVRVSAGYRLPDDSLELYRLSVMNVAEVLASVDTSTVVLSLEGVDQLSLLDSAFTEAWSHDAGNAMDTALSIVRQVFPADGNTVVVYGSTQFSVPAMAAEQGESRMEVLQQILQAIGCHIFTDRVGRIRIEEIPATAIDDTEAPLWFFGDGTDQIPFSGLTRLWSGAQVLPSGVKVTGGANTDEDPEISVTVWDKDPRSETYFDPASAETFAATVELQNPLVISSTQGIHAGYALLRRDGTGGGQFQFSCNPNPAMREGDVIEISEPKLGIDGQLCKVRRIQMPLDLSGPMIVTARGGWDPEYGLDVIGTDNDDGQNPATATVSDDFNRSDENLDAGNWTEFGYSWNLKSNRVEQNNSDLSFARFNDPVTSTDHWVQATVSVQPNEAALLVGPMCRSDGQHQGYAWVVFADNVIGLVKILNGSIIQWFGSWDAGSSVAGDVLRIEASGNSIVGKHNGTTRVTGTDSGFPSGRYLGMVGKGKFGSVTPPTLDDWSGGNL